MRNRPLFDILSRRWLGEPFKLDTKTACSENELATYLFQKGMEKLALSMPFDPMPEYAKNALLHWKKGQTTLYEALRIEQRKGELAEARKTGDVKIISDKEREIADKIQMAVCSFPFILNSHNPAEIIQNGGINCRGASVLGGALLSEVGIRYLVGDVPYHSIVVLTPSDGTLEWRDFLAPCFNETLTEETLGALFFEAQAFAKVPMPQGLMLDVAGDEYRNKLSWVKKGQRQFLTLFPPVLGQRMQVLNGVAYHLAYSAREETNKKKRAEYFKRSLEAYRLALFYEPKYEYAYNGMGDVLYDLGRFEEAITSYHRSRLINQRSESCYYGLGNAYAALGKKNEALSWYEKFIERADEERFPYWISEAKKRVEEFS